MAHAAIAFDSTSGHAACANQTSSSGSTLTITVTFTSGNAGFVSVSFPNTTNSVSSVTDNATGGSSSYVSSSSLRKTGNSVGVELWHTATPSGVKSGVTSVTVNTGTGRFGACAWNYSGALAFGNIATGTTGSSAAPSISLTTQDSNNYIVSGMGKGTGTSSWAATTGNLRISMAGTSTDSGTAAMDNTVASAGSVTTTASITSTGWDCVAIELRTVAPSCTTPFLSLMHVSAGCG